jgi:glycosyltransferase involved in cell wall biosynthesis
LFYKLEARRLKKDEENIDKIATDVLQVASRNNEVDKSNRIIIPITYSFEENFFSQEKKYSNEIVFLGTLSYWPNVDAIHWFIDKVFPIIRRSLPNTVFKIAGKGKVKLNSRVHSIPGVELVGAVTSAIDFLSRAAAVVVPVRKGTGMQNKILEAAWIGKEIICTSFAAEPFNAVCKTGLRIANSPKNFANEIIDVLKNPRGENDMEVWARQIRRDYGLDALKRQLKNLLLNEYNLGG